MNGAGEQVFTRSRFSLQENRSGVGRGDFLREFFGAFHHRRFADYFPKVKTVETLSPNGFDFAPQLLGFKSVAQSNAQFFQSHWLADKSVCPAAQSRNRVRDTDVSGD